VTAGCSARGRCEHGRGEELGGRRTAPPMPGTGGGVTASPPPALPPQWWLRAMANPGTLGHAPAGLHGPRLEDDHAARRRHRGLSCIGDRLRASVRGGALRAAARPAGIAGGAGPGGHDSLRPGRPHRAARPARARTPAAGPQGARLTGSARNWSLRTCTSLVVGGRRLAAWTRACHGCRPPFRTDHTFACQARATSRRPRAGPWRQRRMRTLAVARVAAPPDDGLTVTPSVAR